MPRRGERKQAAVRDLVEAMAEGVVGAQRQAGELLGRAGLQAGVVAARAGAEFVDAAEALSRAADCRRRARSSHCTPSGSRSTGPDRAHARRACRRNRRAASRARPVRARCPRLHCRKYGVFSVPLGKVFRLTASGQVGAPRQSGTGRHPRKQTGRTGWPARSHRRRCLATPGAMPTPPTCPLMPPTKTGRIGRVGRAEVGDLRRDDVVEDAAARVQRHRVRQLVGHRRARLPTEERRGRERAAHIGLDGLVQAAG